MDCFQIGFLNVNKAMKNMTKQTDPDDGKYSLPLTLSAPQICSTWSNHMSTTSGELIDN